MTASHPLLTMPATDRSNPTLDLPETYNVAQALVDGAITAGWGDRIALRSAAGNWTYTELADATHRLGNALLALGVEMEQRVGVLLFDSPEHACTFFGAIMIGAVPIPMNTGMRPQDYLYVLNDSRARVLVVEDSIWPQIAPYRRELTHLRHVIVVRRDDTGAPHVGTIDYVPLLSGASPRLQVAQTSRDDAAFWLYSSGSTGFPKGCVHLQHDIHCCVELYAKPILEIGPEDITFSAAKLFFAYGLGNGLYFPLAVGGSAVHYPGRVTPEAAFQVINDFHPTIFFGVPTLYAAMLALPDVEKRFDTSSLRVCVSAGEALPAELFLRWRDRFGVEILDGIGSTEILHIFVSNRPGHVVPGSSGQVVPGYAALIVDEQGEPVRQGEIGNLLVAGDSICSQYWNKHERTRTTIIGPWIQTGDKYYQDEQGIFWYGGRSDDMLKVSGQWVSPVEVESALVSHPSVLEAAVVGRPDADDLIKPYAFVVLKDGVAPSEELAETLKQHVKATLLPVKYPRWVEFVPELPKTATGKIQRYRLRERVGGRAVERTSASEEE